VSWSMSITAKAELLHAGLRCVMQEHLWVTLMESHIRGLEELMIVQPAVAICCRDKGDGAHLDATGKCQRGGSCKPCLELPVLGASFQKIGALQRAALAACMNGQGITPTSRCGCRCVPFW
jgi:hypothetical protein